MVLRLFKNLVNQIKEIISAEFGIMNHEGLILDSSLEKKVGQIDPSIQKIIQSKGQFVVREDTIYQKIHINNKLELITYIKENSEENMKNLALISISASNIKTTYDEKFDKCNFIKNIIMEDILPGDISLRTKELHLQNNAYRLAFLIRTENVGDKHVFEVIQSMFPHKSKDFVLILDEERTVLIRELKTKDDYKEVERTAKIIVDTLSTELMIKAYVGIGTIVDNIRDISRSFKEAEFALLVGRVFEDNKYVINYNNLGIGRLIYQLPSNLCKLFLKEVFKDSSFEAIDSETFLTIQKFFENNLNISETSRQLYIHRNTLVYRLDKVQKITGLDLRNFDDAIIFKVSMLVKKYLEKVGETTD